MREKVFRTLFRLISSGQLTVEEAYYLMQTLFEDKPSNTYIQPQKDYWKPLHQQPLTSDPVIDPWWTSNTITAVGTTPGFTGTSSGVSSNLDNLAYTATSACCDQNTVSTVSTAVNLGDDSDIHVQGPEIHESNLIRDLSEIKKPTLEELDDLLS